MFARHRREEESPAEPAMHEAIGAERGALDTEKTPSVFSRSKMDEKIEAKFVSSFRGI
jgi:hypothetical protein